VLKKNSKNETLVHHKDGDEVEVDDMMGRIEYGYGSGYINGFLATEKMCFSKEKDAAPCISAVKMIEADQATGVSNDKFAGIVGLSPRSSETNLAGFLSQVHDLNVVSTSEQLSPLFSIFLAKNSDEDGMITFGGYDIAKYAKPGLTDKDIFWGKAMYSEKYWTLQMKDVGQSNSLADGDFSSLGYQIKSKFLIVDSGVSYALIPTHDFVAILDNLSKIGVKCVEPKDASLVTTYSCDIQDYNKLPDLLMRVSNGIEGHEKTKDLRLPKESYMTPKDGSGYKLKLVPNETNFGNQKSSNYWVMGAIFLHNYYSIYDYKDMKMGFINARE
jgi:hypothetical protein